MRVVQATMVKVVGVIACVSSCNHIAGIHEGALVECAVVEDCVVEVQECRTAVACEGGACVFDDALDGTPLAEQKAGDCAEIVCDGNGGTRIVQLIIDAEDGNICTLDMCDGAMPTHTIQAEVPCYGGLAGTEDVGICRLGLQYCDNQGNPVGGCQGEVLPGPETCDAAQADEDCDGEANEEGVNCVCGDGYLSVGEDCDDGNTDDCDGCRGDCSAVEACGDGILCGGEGCDDGGTSDGDRCSPTCQVQEVLQVAAGLSHTCALLTGGIAKCWGQNDKGQLGLGDTWNRGDGPNEMGDNLPAVSLGTGKTALAISVGGSHTCALLDDASVKCWGDNYLGRLGLGDTENRGDGPDEMGDNLPAVSLGTGKTALAISAGHFHTCALHNDASVKCWGYNIYGELGLGDALNRGDGLNEMGDNLPVVSLGTGKTALAISAGSSHTCALLADASVKCWGYNVYGDLGVGDTANRGDGPNEMGNNLSAVSLGTGKSAVSISAGLDHTCARVDDASIKCWGWNNSGSLGLGNTWNRGDGPNEMGNNLPTVKLFSALW